ncbi:putative Mg(2+) transport ATPase [compost metagenome]
MIRGLTTAAGLWAVASVGLAAGAGLYLAALMTTLLLWAILALLKPLEQRYLRRRARTGRLRLRLAEGTSLAKVQAAAEDAGLPVKRITLRRRDEGNDIVDIDCDPPPTREQMLDKAQRLGAVEGVVSVELAGQERVP